METNVFQPGSDSAFPNAKELILDVLTRFSGFLKVRQTSDFCTDAREHLSQSKSKKQTNTADDRRCRDEGSPGQLDAESWWTGSVPPGLTVNLL